MKNKFLMVAMAVLVVGLSSCHQQPKNNKSREHLPLAYARLLSMSDHDGLMEATIADPWQEGRTLQTVSVGHSQAAHAFAPFQRVIVFSTAHCYLLECLGLAGRIVGVCDARYILIPDIQKRLKDGRIKDCGDSMSPDIERIISLNPDAIFASPFEGSGGFGKLEKLGIPIVQTADYMETSALGRAEWMRYYGRLFGEGRRADSLFHVVDSNYQSLRNFAARLPLGRSILTERKTGSTWYTPGGTSSIGMIIKDAHGRYAFADDKHGGSLALSAEQIIDKAGESDVWAFKYNGTRMMTRQDLLREYHGYVSLKAFRTGAIYECNTTEVPYFEEVPFRPDYLLREMIQLLHPKTVLGGLRYYRPLNAKS
ncbi:MAG: ABC transporter substrate-binding protein [Prevotella sp.]|nr:ABC transporter substrate-binding protein [Prevotella sp.]